MRAAQLLTMLWLVSCHGQDGFRTKKVTDEEKEYLVRKLLNSSQRLVLLSGVIRRPHILRTQCWTTKKTRESVLGYSHQITYRVRINGSRRLLLRWAKERIPYCWSIYL
ncbi:uncharacterized protein LOC144100552 [Amblyomma americanum]